MKILLAYPKHFGNSGWYVERALFRLSSVYVLSIDLRSYKSGAIHFLKKKFGTSKEKENVLKSRMIGLVATSMSRIGFTSEPKYSIDVKSILSKIGDVDLLIHVDGPGTPVIKNVDKVSQSILWAQDTHLKLNYLLRIAHSYDYIFVAQKRDLNKFRKVNPKSYWLPFAADPTIHKPYNDANIIYDIIFVGSLIPGIHNKRIQLIRRLKAKFNLTVLQDIWLDQMARVYSSSKLVFNRSASGDLNMRVFEALSCGATLITDMADGILDIFEDKKHLIIYDDSNLEELIQYYLENERERKEIASKGMQEVWQNHTYDLRVREMFRKIGLKFDD